MACATHEKRGLTVPHDRMTAELLWSLPRVGSPDPSPDGVFIVVPVTTYDVETNEGTCRLWRVPTGEGAPRALKLLDQVFQPEDAPWRGIGTIPKSGLQLRPEYEQYDASKKFDILVESDYSMPAGCKCGEVLRAMIYPWECPLFNKACNPDNPVGPCMVSHEGSCYIAARYGVDEI